VQPLAPVAVDCVPNAQLPQTTEPASDEYMPAPQLVHALTPLAEYVPGKQLAHDADDAALDVAR